MLLHPLWTKKPEGFSPGSTITINLDSLLVGARVTYRPLPVQLTFPSLLGVGRQADCARAEGRSRSRRTSSLGASYFVRVLSVFITLLLSN